MVEIFIFQKKINVYILNNLGGGILNGELCVEMEPIQVNDESCSIAIFRNLYFSTSKKKYFIFKIIYFFKAGKFIIEARCTNKPEINISSQPIQICKKINF